VPALEILHLLLELGPLVAEFLDQGGSHYRVAVRTTALYRARYRVAGRTTACTYRARPPRPPRNLYRAAV
jgi:hypothetical protein